MSRCEEQADNEEPQVRKEVIVTMAAKEVLHLTPACCERATYVFDVSRQCQ